MKSFTKIAAAGILVAGILAASFPASAGDNCSSGYACSSTTQNQNYPQDHSWDRNDPGANGGGR